MLYTGHMGLFSSNKRILDLTETLSEVRVNLAVLAADVAKIRSDYRNLEMEWTNAHDKLKSISGRIVKRQGLDDVTQSESPSPEPGPAALPDPYAGMDPVSKKIHMRRNTVRRP